MRRREFLCGCGCCGLLAGLPAFALAEGEWHMPSRFQRPEAGGDEGGLWALLDREEAKLKRSRFVVRDKTLNDYLAGIACRLAGDHCPDVRGANQKQVPHFRAAMELREVVEMFEVFSVADGSRFRLAKLAPANFSAALASASITRWCARPTKWNSRVSATGRSTMDA